jgi:hypothetical protein
MKKYLTLPLAALLCTQAVAATTPRQQRSQPKPAGSQAAKQQPATQQQQRRREPDSPDLNAYGIQVAPDPRLIVMMAALEAAGWDPTPTGASPAVFREAVRKDLSALDPALRARMRDFYTRSALKDAPDDPKTPENEAVHNTPAEQAARYVSLAYTLGQPPAFDAPQRSDDLPSGVLDVLDFVPLLREFYKQSGTDGRMNTYMQMHRAAGERLRDPSIDMARGVLAYLNTRPETTVVERVKVDDTSASKKKNPKELTVSHERERHFRIVPDLLAAPGAINFRATGDDYYAIVPADIDPRQSEIRRAYLQFVIDPLVARFSRDVAARREEIKQILEKERARRGRDLSPDVFLVVARSLVAAADVRMDASARLRALQLETSRRLQAATTQAQKDAALADSKAAQVALADSATAQLAEAYERGAVLCFYFAEQLASLEGSGFDISNFISPMVADFKSEREMSRPAEFAAAVERAREARRRASAERIATATPAPADDTRTALIKSLADVDDLLRVRNYSEAETRLTALREQYREEPLVYFALGQAASLSAQEAFDENLQAERLNRALAHFRQAILFATSDSDRTIVLRSHLASGRILAHLERNDDAAKEFDAVINSSDPADRFHQEAVAEKKKLGSQ